MTFPLTLSTVLASISWKNGLLPGYRLCHAGTINDIELRRDGTPIQTFNAILHQLSLELVLGFSLINPKTYEIKAALSAMDDGNDTRMTKAAGAGATRAQQDHAGSSRPTGRDGGRRGEGQFSTGTSPSRRNQRDVRTEEPVEARMTVLK